MHHRHVDTGEIRQRSDDRQPVRRHWSLTDSHVNQSCVLPALEGSREPPCRVLIRSPQLALGNLADPLRSDQSVRKPVQASLDHLAVTVVAQGVDQGMASVKMVTRLVQLAELAVTLGEVEVQRGIEAGVRAEPRRRALRARR